MENNRLTIFIPLEKIDEEKREVWGVMAEEVKDKTGEIFDYESSKPYVQEWNQQFYETTGGKSLGNLRVMHALEVGGKLIACEFDDDNRKIHIGGKVTSDTAWNDVQEGVLTGFSLGGDYIRVWKDDAGDKRYTAKPAEVSLVDNPCMYGAQFQVIRADGSTELRKFHPRETPRKDDAMLSKEEFIKLIDAAKDRTGSPGAAAAELAVSLGGPLGKTIAPRLAKSLYDVGALAGVLQQLSNIQYGLQQEAEWEQDGSQIPARLAASVKDLSVLLVDLATEESSELTPVAETPTAVKPKETEMATATAPVQAAATGALGKLMTPDESAKKHLDKAFDCHQQMGKAFKALGYDDAGGEDDPDEDEQEEEDDADKAVKAKTMNTSNLNKRDAAFLKALGAITDKQTATDGKMAELETAFTGFAKNFELLTDVLLGAPVEQKAAVSGLGIAKEQDGTAFGKAAGVATEKPTAFDLIKASRAAGPTRVVLGKS